MEHMHVVLESVILVVSIVGALIVIWGILETLVGFIGIKVRFHAVDAIHESERIRQRLGAHLLLGLEIFIAADVISSVASPTWEKVGILASIVGIRTVLSYFLRMELKQGAAGQRAKRNKRH
jgi:uncharacterized membrane protein